MAIFKAPRASTVERLGLTLEVSEIVFDTDLNIFFGGDGVTIGGFPLGKGSNSTVIKIVLTENDILNKYITLPIEPFYPESVLLTPVGGIAQVYSNDYIVQNNILSWSGLGLDGFLEIGETILVQI